MAAITKAKYLVNALNNGVQFISAGILTDLLEKYKFSSTETADTLNKDYGIIGSFNKDLYKDKGIEALNTLQHFIENSRATDVDALRVTFKPAPPVPPIPPAPDLNLSDILTAAQKTTINTAIFTNNNNDDSSKIIHDIGIIIADLNNNDSHINPVSMGHLINGYHKLHTVLKTRLDADLAEIDKLFRPAAAPVAIGEIREQLLRGGAPQLPLTPAQIDEIQQNMKAAVQKQYDDELKTYTDKVDKQLAELNLRTEQAYKERQIILALHERASDADKDKFLQPGIGAGIVVGNPAQAANTLKLKSLDELLANQNGNPATITTLTGLNCTYDEATDKLTINIPRTLFSLSFYHTSIDSRVTADFEFLARARKALQMKNGNKNKDGTPDDTFKPIIGSTVKYASDKQGNHPPLSAYHKKICIIMIQAGLNAGYPLDKIEISCHGLVIKAAENCNALGINHEMLATMQEQSKKIKDQYQRDIKHDLDKLVSGGSNIQGLKSAKAAQNAGPHTPAPMP